MNFTDEWEKSADDHEANWRAWTGHLTDPLILEIGSYEGRSALLWLKIHPEGHVDCVDPFQGTEHGNEYEARFDENTKDAGQLMKHRGRSCDVLPESTWPPFDVVYIDGDHTAAATLLDAALAWPRLTIGGVMIFDDYEWKSGGPRPGDTPKLGVDTFLASIKGQYEELGRGWQVAIRKVFR